MSDLIEEHGTNVTSIVSRVAKEYDPLSISGKDGTTIFRIDNQGKIFWNGREVESDEEFRKTMINLTNYLFTLVFKG